MLENISDVKLWSKSRCLSRGEGLSLAVRRGRKQRWEGSSMQGHHPLSVLCPLACRNDPVGTWAKSLPVLLKSCTYSKMESEGFSHRQHLLSATKAGKQALSHFLLWKYWEVIYKFEITHNLAKINSRWVISNCASFLCLYNINTFNLVNSDRENVHFTHCSLIIRPVWVEQTLIS